MSKESEIMREHIRTHRTVLSMCNEPEDVVLNRLLDDFDRKDQRIAELEEQLKNAIVPKFKIGQEVYVIFDRTLWGERMVEIVSAKIIGIIATTKIQYMFSNLAAWYKEENVFATKEEAEAKLKELRGERDAKD